uniref:Uncharacterized protein n=1 Tax=Anguilla anguilla TaxID=7936 RepID=A0A0E9TWT5_ANGAN
MLRSTPTVQLNHSTQISIQLHLHRAPVHIPDHQSLLSLRLIGGKRPTATRTAAKSPTSSAPA